MNYLLTIEYEGTRYEGWQRQKKTTQTIQGKLEQVLSRMTEKEIEIDGAGRTDAGVHAKNQTASVHLAKKWDPKEILQYMNQLHDMEFHSLAHVFLGHNLSQLK